MKFFSKKEIEAKERYGDRAICNSCGEWGTTNLSPKELQEREWECADCVNKHLNEVQEKENLEETEPQTPTELTKDPGSEEISKYHPTYNHLIKLIQLVTKEGVNPQEIKQIVDASPFNTVDDAGNLAAKIWTLATETYKIPREWLIKHLPEKKIKADLTGYLNQLTKQVSDFISSEPTLTEMVLSAADAFNDDVEYMFWMKKTLELNPDIHVIDMESGKSGEQIQWYELAWFWYNNAKHNKPIPGEKLFNINELPTLDKKQKLDELLDQFSAETDPVKKEKIKQHIERIKRAKLLKADLWPGQEASQPGTQAPWNYYAYQYGQDKDTSVSGPNPNPNDKVSDKENPSNSQVLYAAWSLIEEYFFRNQERWSSIVKRLKEKHPELTVEEIARLKQHVKDTLSHQTKNIEAKKKGLTLEKVLQILETKEPKPSHVDYTKGIIEFVDGSSLSFDAATKKALELDKKSDVEVNNTPEMNFFWGPTDLGKQEDGDWPSDSWLPSGQAEKDQQPYSNVSASIAKEQLGKELKIKSFSKKELNKQANPPSRFWIAPDGTEFPTASAGHGAWLNLNKKILKEYGVNTSGTLDMIAHRMYNQGWSRISNEPHGSGFQIQIGDPRKIPSYIDDFIAKNFSEGDEIVIGNQQLFARITNPFPSIQKAVNKDLQPVATWASKKGSLNKQANPVEDILQLVNETGGATYQLSEGNKSGTDNYAVSIHPDRSVILDHTPTEEELTKFVEQNNDLIGTESIGIWKDSSSGKWYLDIVTVIPDREEAIKLGKEHNQIAIFDLKNFSEIPTGGTGKKLAFSKKELLKKADDSPLTQKQQDEIAATTSPVYNIALNNYYDAKRRGHDKNRSLSFAIDSVKNLEKIDPKKLLELIATYLVGI